LAAVRWITNIRAGFSYILRDSNR
jgi:hypothetical protein